MKFKIFLIISLAILQSCNNVELAKEADSEKTRFSVFKFRETAYDFGTIHDGDTVSHNFFFQNDSNIPLIISDISVGCGCTVVTWPKEPIIPGKFSNILIRFSKRHDIGQHYKTAIIKANTKNPYTVLVIKARTEK